MLESSPGSDGSAGFEIEKFSDYVQNDSYLPFLFFDLTTFFVRGQKGLHD